MLKLASILNNTICSVIACLFLLLSRRKLNNHKVSTAGWFAAYFLCFSIAFGTTVMRGWVSIEWVVLSNNFLYQAVTYMLLFGVMSWFKYPAKRTWFVFAALHTFVYTAFQFWLLKNFPQHFEWRVNLAAVSFSAVHLYSAWFAFRHMNKKSGGEKLLTFCLVLSSLFVFLPATLYQLFDSTIYFLSGVLVGQNLLTIVSLGSILSLFFYDEIEWHHYRAVHDELTGLYNRRYFMEQASSELDNSSNTWTIALLDVDHFKQVNDRYGHDAGDLALCHIADILSREFKGDLVARYGGEEFTIMLAGHQATNQLRLEHFHREVSRNHLIAGELDIAMTVSIGIAEVSHSSALQRALKMADIALYDAKETGRNRLVPLV